MICRFVVVVCCDKSVIICCLSWQILNDKIIPSTDYPLSFTKSDEGYPESDEQLAKEVLEALIQFMLVYPSMVSGGISSKTPVYAFGESYGGSYVTSLAKVYLNYR